jgi:hypothetical protein
MSTTVQLLMGAFKYSSMDVDISFKPFEMLDSVWF